MQHRRLGRTNLSVGEIGFGAWGIGGGLWRGSDDAESRKALRAAVRTGINLFDTALVYGNGRSEGLLAELRAESDRELIIATKIPPVNQRWPGQGTLEETFPKNHVIDAVHTCLKNLKTDCIDLVQLHVWHPSWIDRLEWHEALSRLREQGKVRWFGVSLNDHQPDTGVELVRRGLVDTVQVIFNIFDPTPLRNLFPACAQADVGVIVRVPFDEGALTGKIDESSHFGKRDFRSRYFAGDRTKQVQKRVERLTSDLGIDIGSLPETALAFCLFPDVVSTVIPGMRRVEHVQANAQAGERRMTAETFEKLRAHAWEKNFYT